MWPRWPDHAEDMVMNDQSPAQTQGAPPVTVAAKKQAIDPVCGVAVDLRTTAHRAEHRGRTFYFCSVACRTTFLAEPLKYRGGKEKTASLEPEYASAYEGANRALADLTLRFWIGLALAVPVAVLEIGRHIVHARFDPTLTSWIEFVLATPVVLWAGWPIFVRGYRSIADRTLDSFTLLAIAIGMAYVYSALAGLAPRLFPPALLDPGGAVPVYFAAATIMTVLAILGLLLESRARTRTFDAIRALLDLAPKTARRLKDKGDEEVPIEAVAVDDRLRVRAGEQVPVDGVLIEGRPTLDESMVIGESPQVSKQPGAKVIAGTINRSGSFVMRAEKVGRDTLLSEIVQTITLALHSPAPIQRVADQVSNRLVLLVIAVAPAAFAGWSLFGPQPRLAYGVVAAVSVLVIACPCALGLATQISILAGIGRGAELGVLFKHAEAMERMEKVDTLVIDKTGILTEGRPRVTSILPAPGFDTTEVLRLAASVEHASEHPLARAIAEAAAQRKLRLATVHEFDSESGRGVTGVSERRRIVLGNARLLADLNIPLALAAEAERLRVEGATAIFLAVDGRVAGVIAISDPVKVTTADAMAAIREDGQRVVLMTGDDRTTAIAVVRRLGISEVDAEVLPDRKAAAVERLRSEGRVVALVGDGINHASELAAADVGIAMSSGTEAGDKAGIALLKNDLSGLVRAKRLSQAVIRNIRQSRSFAFFYNASSVPIAGILPLIFGLKLSPVLAAAAMTLASVYVVRKALRLRRVEF
jgi:Cu+-exporting ATPase